MKTAGLLLFGILFLLLRGLLTLYKHPNQSSGDIGVYYRYAGDILLHGRVPYHDFSIEYPPLALLTFLLPLLPALIHPLTIDQYAALFLCESLALTIAAGVALAKIAVISPKEYSPQGVMAIFIVGLILLSLILPWRFDIFPALLTLLGLLALLKGRAGWAGCCLGLGVAAKAYPIVLVPVFLLYYLSQKDWGRLRALLFGTAAAGLIVTLPFWLLSPHGLFYFVFYQRLRGLQIESLAAGALMLSEKFAHSPIPMVYAFGSYQLDAPQSPFFIKALPLLFLVLYTYFLWFTYRLFQQEMRDDGRISTRTLAASIVAAIVITIISNKVFSPQYLVWILPFVPLLKTRSIMIASAAAAATAVLYPVIYGQLLAHDLLSILLLNLRNLLMIALLASLLIVRPFLAQPGTRPIAARNAR